MVSVPADVSRTRSTQVGFVVLRGYGLCLDGVEESLGRYEDQEIEVRRGEVVVVVHGHPPHVRKVNVNISIAWATIFAWGLGCRGGPLVCRHGSPTAAVSISLMTTV